MSWRIHRSLLCYFRSSDGLECDLVLDAGGHREVIEIKFSSQPEPSDFRKLDKIARLVNASRWVLPEADH